MAVDRPCISEPPDPIATPADQSQEIQAELYAQNYWSHFWFSVWAMTATAGAVFGTLQFPVAGTVAGAFIAAFLAPPFVMTAAAVTWACWLSRLAVLQAAGAGAATGVFSTAIIWDSIFAMNFAVALIWAGFIGGLGGGLGGAIYMWKYPLPQVSDTRKKSETWKYSLSELFIRFTVLSVVIAGWSLFLSELFR